MRKLLLKTLKQEEIHCREYRDLEDLWIHSIAFIDDYYNRRRLQSALGYRSPKPLEEEAGRGGAAEMSFSRHEEIYPDHGQA